MLRFIAMHCGYVENCSTSLLVYQCGFHGSPGYTSYKQAITDLALDLYAKYYEDVLSTYHNRYTFKLNKCCTGTLISNKEAKFCTECGTRLLDKSFDYDGFMEYVTNLHYTITDSYGEAETTSTRDLAWWPFWTSDFIGAPKEDIIYIAENAEVVLLEALLEAKPELRQGNDDLMGVSDWEEFKKEQQPSYR